MEIKSKLTEDGLLATVTAGVPAAVSLNAERTLKKLCDAWAAEYARQVDDKLMAEFKDMT